MLSIALIAAALLIAGWVVQLRGRDRAVADRSPSSAATLSGLMQQAASGPVRPASEIVALVLRVQSPDCACENARKYADKTFLVGDAPKLPFNNCTRVDCRCRYERISERRRTRGDRRVKANRREEIRFEMKDDRRSGKDRRQKNNAWKQPV